VVQYSIYRNENTLADYYIAAGLSFDYLLSASIKSTSYREYHSPVSEENIKTKPQRNTINSGALVAAGYKRKFGKGFLVAEVRYKIGLQTMSGKEDTYANSVLVFDHKFVDGIFKINTLSLSVGYVLNRYNPKKLRLNKP
jgi:hypothetical protein